MSELAESYQNLVVKRYYIADAEGRILTGVEDHLDLQWTPQAMMEEYGARAVLYKNPYHVPQRIADQLGTGYSVFCINIDREIAFADMNDTLDAKFAGYFSAYSAHIPTRDFTRNKSRRGV